MAKKKAKEFKDTLEATEFMDTLYDMLNDPRLLDWANVTDENYLVTTEQKLRCARRSFNAFTQEMFTAGE